MLLVYIQQIEGEVFDGWLCGMLKAFECDLCKIKPSNIKCPAGNWTMDARRRFEQFIINATDCYATVRGLLTSSQSQLKFYT